MIATKLGWKDGLTHWVVDPPEGFDIGFARRCAGTPDVILAFARDAAALAQASDAVVPRYRRGARLWFAYPKKLGRLKSDIDRDHGWEPLTRHDLLPVMQVALDADWSALRFRYRDEIAKLTRRF